VVRPILAGQSRDAAFLVAGRCLTTPAHARLCQNTWLSKGAREVVTCALTQKPWAPEGKMASISAASDFPNRPLPCRAMAWTMRASIAACPYIGALDKVRREPDAAPAVTSFTMA